MWLVALVLTVFVFVGLGCLALIKDWRGFRSFWVGPGDPDSDDVTWRRRGILMFAWVGLAGSIYAVAGFVIGVLLEAIGLA
ncbi:hypothetical protein AB0950_39130 [Streptomyces sp. NPDC007189]|uniref:hypothetical protein n=1 Tax=Streptomyces sp. NPDC007189 TaxID=3154315 RepID=UPI00345387F9